MEVRKCVRIGLDVKRWKWATKNSLHDVHKSRHKHLYPVWNICIWHHIKHFTLGFLWARWTSVMPNSNLTRRRPSRCYAHPTRRTARSFRRTHTYAPAKNDMVKRSRFYSEDGKTEEETRTHARKTCQHQHTHSQCRHFNHAQISISFMKHWAVDIGAGWETISIQQDLRTIISWCDRCMVSRMTSSSPNLNISWQVGAPWEFWLQRAHLRLLS